MTVSKAGKLPSARVLATVRSQREGLELLAFFGPKIGAKPDTLTSGWVFTEDGRAFALYLRQDSRFWVLVVEAK